MKRKLEESEKGLPQAKKQRMEEKKAENETPSHPVDLLISENLAKFKALVQANQFTPSQFKDKVSQVSVIKKNDRKAFGCSNDDTVASILISKYREEIDSIALCLKKGLFGSDVYSLFNNDNFSADGLGNNTIDEYYCKIISGVMMPDLREIFEPFKNEVKQSIAPDAENKQANLNFSFAQGFRPIALCEEHEYDDKLAAWLYTMTPYAHLRFVHGYKESSKVPDTHTGIEITLDLNSEFTKQEFLTLHANVEDCLNNPSQCIYYQRSLMTREEIKTIQDNLSSFFSKKLPTLNFTKDLQNLIVEYLVRPSL